MATILFDGSVCLNREGACFKYYSALAPRIAQRGHSVVFTPGQDEVLDAMQGPGITVLHRTIPKAPSWFPQGKLRKALGQVRRFLEGRKVKQAASSSNTNEKAVFFSFYFGTPPDAQLSTVTMVHDLIVELKPENTRTAQDRDFIQRRIQAMQNAKSILCISENTQQDLEKFYPEFVNKTACAYIGIDIAFFQERVAEKVAKETLRNLGISRPYILHVGGRLHHKNFPLLAKGYAQSGLKDRFDLICTGEKLTEEEVALFKTLGIQDTLKHIRFPEESTLRLLYQNAACFAYPSKYEGFGIPPLEAMASGCPVIAARGGSIPEVSGPGAWLVSTEDPKEMAQALTEMVRPEVAAQYKARGYEHVKNFSWEPIADRTLELFLR